MMYIRRAGERGRHIHGSDKNSADAEIADFDLVRFEKDIFRFEITMQNARFVYVLNGNQDLDEPLDHVVFGQRSILLFQFFQALIEIATFAKLRDDTETVVLEKTLVELEKENRRRLRRFLGTTTPYFDDVFIV